MSAFPPPCTPKERASSPPLRCLAEKMGDPDFGEECRLELVKKLQRRQANWKLDPPLRKACKPSVEGLCSQEDNKGSEEVSLSEGGTGKGGSLGDSGG